MRMFIGMLREIKNVPDGNGVGMFIDMLRELECS
jgi:hypothetical protein